MCKAIYQISVAVTDMKDYAKILPVTQMLSERHNANKFKDWLEHYRDSSGVVPDECIYDGSSALKNAIALAFNNCTYVENLIANHLFLMEKSSELKPCFMRDDRNHFIKAFTRLKCWKITENDYKKKFFTHCMGYCIGINNLPLIKPAF